MLVWLSVWCTDATRCATKMLRMPPESSRFFQQVTCNNFHMVTLVTQSSSGKGWPSSTFDNLNLWLGEGNANSKSMLSSRHWLRGWKRCQSHLPLRIPLQQGTQPRDVNMWCAEFQMMNTCAGKWRDLGKVYEKPEARRSHKKHPRVHQKHSMTRMLECEDNVPSGKDHKRERI